MKSIYSIVLVVFLFISCAPDTEKELAERINRIENNLQPAFQIVGDSIPTFNIEERLKELGIPGLSIAVLNNGEIEWAKAYGYADVSEDRKMNTETMLLAGSISKPVSALRAHQLAEQGVLDLDANINDYLTSWKLPDNEFTEKEKVTTKRILNHTAGLTVWGFPGYDKGDTIPSVPEVLDGKGNTPEVRVYKEPGESWRYSGGGYTIMQLMLTDVEKESFPSLMQKNVLDPLGMTSSTFINPLPEKYHAIAATGYRGNGDEVEGKWPIYPEMAAAGLWTTPSQLILWAKEIQRIQQSDEDGILKNETVKTMLTQGMGNFGIGPQVGEHSYGHGGADEGFRAQMTAWKDKPIAVVMMVNSDNGSIMQELMLSIGKEYDLAGVEPRTRTIKAQTQEELERFVGKFNFEELGDAEIVVKDNGLEITASFIDEPVFMLPESDLKFFDKADGDYFDFVMKDGKVISFTVQGYEATRIK